MGERVCSPPLLSQQIPASPVRYWAISQCPSIRAPIRRATPSPVPLGGALPTLIRSQTKRQCRGIYNGRFGAALQFAGRAMLNTGRLLLEWSREHDAGVTSFARSALAQLMQMLLPHRGMDVRRAGSGFSIFHTECQGKCDGLSRKRRCDVCDGADDMRRDVRTVYQPAVPAKEAAEYNYFAEETWGCIQALVLAHVAIIQLHCVEKNVEINPRVINTDAIEWFFGDARSMVGGATNKLRAKDANAADRKASAFNRGRHGAVGNNKSGTANVFKREQNRFNA